MKVYFLNLKTIQRGVVVCLNKMQKGVNIEPQDILLRLISHRRNNSNNKHFSILPLKSILYTYCSHVILPYFEKLSL